MGHTAFTPEGREGRSQAGPKGRQLEVGPRRGPRLLVYIYLYWIYCQHFGNICQLEGFCPSFWHRVGECTFCNLYMYRYICSGTCPLWNLSGGKLPGLEIVRGEVVPSESCLLAVDMLTRFHNGHLVFSKNQFAAKMWFVNMMCH